MSNLRTCQNNHRKIIYAAKWNEECPLCIAIAENDNLIDARTDIDEADIFDLYGITKHHHKRIRRIEKLLGISPSKAHWWSSKKVTPTSAEPTLPEATF
jgi:hypothetical protein